MGKNKHPFSDQDPPNYFSLSLIGMPGVGKTTLAKSLAQELNWAFVDTDFLLQSWFGLSLEDLRNKLGNRFFLLAEEQIIIRLWLQRCVIATGGSIIYSQSAVQKLKDIGLVVYLQAGYETIARRVARNPQRGLVLNRKQSLQDLFRERTPKYEAAADITISTEKISIQECVQKIKENIHAGQISGQTAKSP